MHSANAMSLIYYKHYLTPEKRKINSDTFYHKRIEPLTAVVKGLTNLIKLILINKILPVYSSPVKNIPHENLFRK